VTQALQVGDPKGRLDLLAVRLFECALKARLGIPDEGTLVVDFLHVGETLSRRFGYHREFSSLRPRLEQLAGEYGVSTVQTLPELAYGLGLLRGRRAGVKRGRPCIR
jgi:hypothetical protein